MSQGNDFANYASSVEDRSSASEDVWFVAVSSDDIKQMTIDQLDEAFRLGVITAQTAVWTEGMEAWAPLGEVADLDGSEETSGEVEAVNPHGHGFAEPHGFDAAAFEPPASASFASPFAQPPAAGVAQSIESVASQRSAHSGWQNPFEGPTSAPTSGSGREETLQSAVRNSIGPTSFAPVTSSYAPSAGGSLANSTGPVALNVDEDMPAVSRGRRFRPERWLLAAAGVIAVAVIGFNNKDLFSSTSSSVANAEKQASAAALIARPYEIGADKGEKAAPSGGSTEPSTAPAAIKTAAADDGDAPIGSLKGEKAEEEESGGEEAASESATKVGSTSKDASKDKESLRGGMAKAFAKGPSAKGSRSSERAEKPAKASKAAKAKLARKPPARAAKAKKGGVTRAASAFDPLNGSLP